MKNKFILIAVLIISSLSSTLIYLINNIILYKVLVVFMYILLFYFIWKKIKILFPIVIKYFFNINQKSFNKSIEKPRVFIYIIFAPICMYSIKFYNEYSHFENYYKITTIIFLTSYSVCLFILYFTWTKQFEENFITSIQSKIIENDKNDFENEMTTNQIIGLYNNLVDNNLIEFKFLNNDSVECEKFFIDTIKSNKIPEQQQFILKMNNIEIKVFWLIMKNKTNGLTLDKFLKIFETPGKSKRSSIDSSYSQTKHNQLKKYHKNINELFEKH